MKIAINGCGIGGPTLAYWLRRHGFEPVLFEKAPGLRTGGHIIDFWGPGYDVADKMGLLPAMSDQAYMMEHLRTVAANGRTTSHMDISKFGEITDGRYMSIARSDLSRIIVDACDGVEIRFGMGIAAIEEHGNKATAIMSDSAREDFDLIIGADGLHSQIRAAHFGEEAQYEKHLGLYVAAFRAFGYPHRDELTYMSHTLPGRQISRVSLRDDETLFLFVLSEEYLPEEPLGEAAQKAALRRAFADMGWETPEILDALDGGGELYFDRASQIRMPTWTSGRVALIGDAAACPSLLAGEGTGLAMLEAYVLAGELKRAAGDYETAFTAYEDRLKALLLSKQEAALRFTGFFAPRNQLGLFLRDTMTNALRLPYIGQKMLAKMFVSDLILPDYLD